MGGLVIVGTRSGLVFEQLVLPIIEGVINEVPEISGPEANENVLETNDKNGARGIVVAPVRHKE